MLVQIKTENQMDQPEIIPKYNVGMGVVGQWTTFWLLIARQLETNKDEDWSMSILIIGYM